MVFLIKTACQHMDMVHVEGFSLWKHWICKSAEATGLTDYLLNHCVNAFVGLMCIRYKMF